MIYSARRLIKSLRKIVDNDNDSIWIDYANKTFQKVQNEAVPDVSCAFPKNEPSIQGLLKYLEDGGYILRHNHEYISLTYKALYYHQIVIHEKVQYFLRSIFVPIILSVVTSILTTTFLPELLSALLQKIL